MTSIETDLTEWMEIGPGYEWRVQLEDGRDEAMVTLRKGDRQWRRIVDTAIVRHARMPAGAYYLMCAETLVDRAEVERIRNSVSAETGLLTCDSTEIN